MTEADKSVLDSIEREALALLERATFSIRDDHHARAVYTDAQAALVAPRRTPDAERRLTVVIDSDDNDYRSPGQTPTRGEGLSE